MIAKLRHFVPRNILLHIYQSLIHPYIFLMVLQLGEWPARQLLIGSLFSKNDVSDLYFFSESRAHAIPLFLDTSVLPVHFLYYEVVCCLMHDAANRIAPSNILDLFIKTSHVHSYNTRSSTSLHNNKINHKNYNFLACDWFKKVLFSTNSLAKLLSDSLLSDSSKSQSHSKM